MKRLIRWVALTALLAFSAGAAAEQFRAGQDYIVLDQPQQTPRGGVEVREFFAYSCPHCFTFATPMHEWVENRAPDEVRYVRSPVIFNDSWRPLAQAYHVAAVLDVVDQVHMPMFSAIHNDRRRFRNLDEIADFFATQGVDRERFQNTARSFAVDTRMRQSEQAMRNYRITSTPSVAVAGKYVITPRTAGSHERMIEVIDHLVRKEAEALR